MKPVTTPAHVLFAAICIGLSFFTTAQNSFASSTGGGNPAPAPTPTIGAELDPTPLQPILPPPTPAPIVSAPTTSMWNVDANGAWSNAANWIGGVPDSGNTANLTFNITGNRAVTIDTTSRTVGILNIGDPDGTDSYTLNASNGASLILDNILLSGGNTQINQTAGSDNNTISAPILLNSSLDITNASAATLTISGNIAGNTAGTKTITTSTGLVSLTGVISNPTGTIAIVQNGPGTLTLNANNSFTGGLTIKSGTVVGGVANSFGGSGTGAITLGDTSGSANASLLGGGNNYANPIAVAAGSSGTLTIGNNGNSSSTFSGAVTLNNNLAIKAGGSGNVKLTGGITGTGNVTLNNNTSTVDVMLDTNLVNNSGTITSAGTGTGTTAIGAKLGANVTQLIQNSSTSTLRLDMTANTAFVGSVAVNAGTLLMNSPTALNSANVVSVASGATFDLGGNSETIAGLDTGTGTVTNTGAARTLTLGGSGNYTFGGTITATTPANMAVIKSGLGTQILTGASTYTGTTTISAGTLSLDNNNTTTARLAGTSNITVNNGGTLLLAQSGVTASNDRINNNATMTLSGGTFNTGGFSEHGVTNNTAGIGALTLTASSIINMGTGSSIIAFADSHLASWTGTLSIYNWTGAPAGGGTDQLYFGNTSGGLTTSQLGEINIYSDSGTTLLGAAMILADGEIVPVPEPATWFTGALLVTATLGIWLRRTHRRRTAATT